MILNRFVEKEVVASEEPIFTILGPNSDGVTIFIENKSNINYINYRFQSSETNISDDYMNIQETSGSYGVNGILAPFEKAMVSIRITSPFIRLLASSSGGSYINCSITQFVNTNSSYYTNGVQ